MSVMVEAGELMARRIGAVDPSKFPDEEFELHSIPAFDSGMPEILRGAQIGSTKQIVHAGDVMISKIVPHIRRASVVGVASGRRQIASSEWIVFRGDRFHPGYLRHLLISDVFNAQFMRTVSGVGGSLLRARPAEVAKIKIPLPPLPEQRRIAAILDKADALRAKRREAIAKLDQLLQSVFLDMFGDGTRWPHVAISEIADVKGGKRLPKGEDYAQQPTPFRYIRVSDIEMGHIQENSLKYLRPEVQRKISRYTVAAGDVVITIAGTIGTVAAVGVGLAGSNLTENAAKISPKRSGDYEAEYLAFALASPDAQSQIASRTGQVTIGKLALFRIEQVTVPLPPIELQTRFIDLRRMIAARKAEVLRSSGALDRMFRSLQAAAFSG